MFSKGQDIISDFNTANNREKIDFSAVASISSFQDLVNNHASQENGDVVISDQLGNSLTLTGIDLADLDQGDFIF